MKIRKIISIAFGCASAVFIAFVLYATFAWVFFGYGDEYVAWRGVCSVVFAMILAMLSYVLTDEGGIA